MSKFFIKAQSLNMRNTKDFVALLLKEASSVSKEAVELEKKYEWNEALNAYKVCVLYLLEVVHLTTSDVLQQKVEKKGFTYIERGYIIRQHLKDIQESKLHLRAGVLQLEPSMKKPLPVLPTNSFKKQLLDSALVQVPDVHYDDVIGLENAKMILEEAIVTPIRFPHSVNQTIRKERGILLYGAAGVGKTTLCYAIANQARHCHFLMIKSGDLQSKWTGETGKLISNLFELADMLSPVIIFIDEAESLMAKRGDEDSNHEASLRTSLLIEMGNTMRDPGVFVILATNLPQKIDPGFCRRVDQFVHIGLPNFFHRVELLKYNLSKVTTHCLTEKELETLAFNMEDFSGGDIETVVLKACKQPVARAQLASHFKESVIQPGTWDPCCRHHKSAKAGTYTSLPGHVSTPPVNFRDFEVALKFVGSTVQTEIKEACDFFSSNSGTHTFEELIEEYKSRN